MTKVNGSSTAFHRRISSSLGSVDAACLALRGFLLTNGLSDRWFPVEMTARESLNNAVIHGNDHDPEKEVLLDVCIGRKWIQVQVTDQGTGIDRKSREKKFPSHGTALCGRGLAICRLYSERIAFNRPGNRITLWISKGEPSCPNSPLKQKMTRRLSPLPEI